MRFRQKDPGRSLDDIPLWIHPVGRVRSGCLLPCLRTLPGVPCHTRSRERFPDSRRRVCTITPVSADPTFLLCWIPTVSTPRTRPGTGLGKCPIGYFKGVREFSGCSLREEGLGWSESPPLQYTSSSVSPNTRLGPEPWVKTVEVSTRFRVGRSRIVE